MSLSGADEEEGETSEPSDGSEDEKGFLPQHLTVWIVLSDVTDHERGDEAGNGAEGVRNGIHDPGVVGCQVEMIAVEARVAGSEEEHAGDDECHRFCGVTAGVAR